MRRIASRLKVGAPFLVYLYYNFENRPWWYRRLWKLSNIVAHASNLPYRARLEVSRAIALLVYWPFARSAYLLERAGFYPVRFPSRTTATAAGT